MKFETGKVRLSFVNVFEPREDLQGRMKYSTGVLISKKDTKTINRLQTAFKQLLNDPKTKEKFGGKMNNVDLPLRDGDDKSETEGYAGHFYINAKANRQPLIVDRDKQEIVDPDEVYSGCYAQVIISLYAYNYQGKRGIAAGLEAVRKLADGPKFGGSTISTNDFDDSLLGDLAGNDLL